MSDWQTVPVEPTYEMVQAAAATPEMKTVDGMIAIAAMHGFGLPMVDWNKSAIACAYRAMLATAPLPPAVRVTPQMVEAGLAAWQRTPGNQGNFMEAALTAALAVSFPIQQDWQPIAGAPKDGRAILLGWQLPHGEVNEGFWFDGVGNHWNQPGWRCTDDDRLTSHPMEPTHWQPLPAPPIQQDADDIEGKQP